MPYAPTPCLDCGKPSTFKGRCATHQPEPWLNSTRKQRLPADWNTRRLIVLKRDRAICYLCGQPGADGVDHVQAGDNHNLNNLRAVHDKTQPYCHRFKSSQEGHEAKASMKVKKNTPPPYPPRYQQGNIIK